MLRKLIPLFVLFMLLAGLSVTAQPASAQCTPHIPLGWQAYVVQRGDTLARIGRRFGVSWRDLATVNCIVNPNRIFRGQVIYVPGLPAPIPTPTPPPGVITVYGSYQLYEGGLMVWRGDTGHIYAIVSGGVVYIYNPGAYGGLPDNIFRTPPPGRFNPILGFGKVWHNFSVRNLLGWATTPEAGLVAIAQGHLFSFNLPTGASYTLDLRNGTWTGSPLPSPIPPPAQPVIRRFDVQPPAAAPGALISLTWDIVGVNSALVEVNDQSTGPDPEAVIGPLPVNGSTSYLLPLSFRGNVTFRLVGIVSRGGVNERAAIAERVVSLIAPLPSPISVYSAYQLYDGGFLIWRSDNGAVYVFYSFGAVSTYRFEDYGSRPDFSETPPGGRIRPINAFGRVYGLLDPTARSFLGWPTAHEQGFNMTVETLYDGTTRLSLPNGSRVQVIGGNWSPA